ncbi:MAG: cupin domain-containing protein [Candidatus Aminicenantales bacterium]
MIVNKEEEDQVNPFPTIFISTRGEGKAKLGEKTITLKKGMMVYIPAGMSHMFWNQKEEPVEGIIIMFGPGA